MTTPTTRLGLLNPVGSDTPSILRTSEATNNSILDNTLIYEEGALGSRPPASGAIPANSPNAVKGLIYRSTDATAETVTLTDGAVWIPLGLVPQTTSADASVVSGQMLITTGSSARAISLPAATNGQLLGVMNRTTNVTTVSGTNIYGLGLSAATSFPLGTVGATVTLIADGTNWNIIAGQQDTGFVALTLVSGWISSALSPYVPAARLRGDQVTLRGVVQNNTGAGSGASAQFATVPVGLRSSSLSTNLMPVAAANGLTFAYVTAAAAGSLLLSINIANGTPIFIDGLSYPM